MKLSMTLLSIAAAVVSINTPAHGQAFTEKSRFDRRPAMSPVRRLGLFPVAHNLADARKNMSDQTTLRGVLAQPLSGEDFASKFNATLKGLPMPLAAFGRWMLCPLRVSQDDRLWREKCPRSSVLSLLKNTTLMVGCAPKCFYCRPHRCASCALWSSIEAHHCT